MSSSASIFLVPELEMTQPKFILYYTNWSTYAYVRLSSLFSSTLSPYKRGSRNFQVKDLPIDYIPEIAYAFVNLKAEGNGWVICTGDVWADCDKRFVTGTCSFMMREYSFGVFALINR